MSIKALHLVPDEKFIDFFAASILQCKGIDNRYIVHGGEASDTLRHIKSIIPFRKVDDVYFSSKLMHADLASCDVLVVHFLTQAAARMICAAPDSVKVVWSGWGADYYHLLPGGENSLYEEKTRHLVQMLKLEDARRSPIRAMRSFLRPFRKHFIRQFIIQKAIERVDYFSAPIPDDYVLLKDCFPRSFRAAYIQLNYGSVGSTFATPTDRLARRDILVGNSATPTNNHCDIFEQLSVVEIDDRRIIVPLSYGDTNYRAHILKIGKSLFGERFFPIVDFLPLYEYNNVLSGCAIAIMNHRRQQAIGNIGALMFGGCKIFLNPKNVTYRFFLNKGACISNIDQISSRGNFLTELSDTEKIKNKKVVEDFWGDAVVKRNFDNFVGSLTKG